MAEEQTKNTPHRIAWTSPKLDRRTTPSAGDGLFANAPITKDEVMVVWGGVIVTTAELWKLPDLAHHRAIQVEEDQHLTSGMVDDMADCVNHSCNPNAGLRGQIVLVAMRDIAPDEEICFDYAMSDAHPTYHMDCACGQENCRGEVTGHDWKRADLQKRYAGYFSPYIQRKIEQMSVTSAQ